MIKVVSFNILCGGKDENIIPERAPRLKEVLAKYAADLVGFQEATPKWLPFLEAGPLECVMVAHVAAPELTGDMTPATMSERMVTELLKEQLGFRGLVITDSLEMGAVTDSYTPGQAALAALNAGCDILLMPADLPEAFEAVVSAVENGEYPVERLDETVLRILKFKTDSGILMVE